MSKVLHRRNAGITCAIFISCLTSLAWSSHLDDDAEEGCSDDGADTIVAKMFLLQTGWEVAPHSSNAETVDAEQMEVEQPPAQRSGAKAEPDAADLLADWTHSVEDVLTEAAQIPLETFREDPPQRNLSLAAEVRAPPVPRSELESQFKNFSNPSRYIELAIIFICAILFYTGMSYVCEWCTGSQDMKLKDDSEESIDISKDGEVSAKAS
mmetsp:Transcript_8716/g.15709  ORF Transcript_8716/g.15709 Transcript_8716/m.15709 type:complete len:210 (-) Transcript_8716:66-695(-)